METKNIGKLYKRIAQVRKAVGSLEPDKVNKEQNYKYISADKILERAGDAMAECGLVIVPAIVETEVITVERGNGKVRLDARVNFCMTVADEDGNEVTQLWIGFGSDYAVPDKAIYKAITSGHKYFYMKLFNIGVGNEDGEHEPPQEEDNGYRNVSRPNRRLYQNGTVCSDNNGKAFDAYVEAVEERPESYEQLREWALKQKQPKEQEPEKDEVAF